MVLKYNTIFCYTNLGDIMTDMNKRVLELINSKNNMKQISAILNISEKQLYTRIKQLMLEGYLLSPSYSYNSDIYYNICKEIKPENNTIGISIPKKEQVFSCIVFSDLHVGNIDSDIRLLDIVYNYAIKKGYNYILNCGDSLEGEYTTDKKSISAYEEQVLEFIKKYPYDRNIINFMIFGNHDYHALKTNGYDVSKKIKNSRYDIVPIGYGQGNVKLKNDYLVLFHRLNEVSEPDMQHDEKIVLSGHGHLMKTKFREELWLCIPTLSYVSTDKTTSILPSFVDLELQFEKGLIDYVTAKQIIITPKPIQISESRCLVKNIR